MPILMGAIAYQASLREKVGEQIVFRQPINYDGETNSRSVLCPKCDEPYILVEGSDATDELIQDDMEFLAKALSTIHPAHPAGMVIRDPDGLLCRHFNLQSTAVAAEPLPSEVFT